MAAFHIKTLGIAFLTCVLCGVPVAGATVLPPWAKASLHLTGENWEVRKQAITELKAIPKLIDELRPALADPDLRALAIDVLVALKLSALNAEIFKLVPADPDGMFVLALNSLMTKADRDTVAERYADLLADVELSPPNTIAILDSLGRMRAPLPEKTHEAYLRHDDPDVRRAALAYTRDYWLGHPQKVADGPKWFRLLGPALTSGTYQTRLQTAHLLSEHAKRFPNEVKTALALCGADRNLEVRRFCRGREKKK